MPGITELLVILLIVALLFGTKKLRSMGGDLGNALKSFRSAIRDEEPQAIPKSPASEGEQVIEGRAESEGKSSADP